MPRHLAIASAVALPLCLAAGLDAWSAAAARDALRAEEDKALDLDESLDDLGRRKAAAATVLGRLEDGRVSLADAAADLEALYRPRDGFMDALRRHYPGATDRERFARWAVGLYRTREQWEPGRHTTTLVRLEVELAALYPPADRPHPAGLPAVRPGW